ncbi:conserved hypothetical protein [Perkinsus marinus ATCC 50983]|uniref:Uncharacterized protein n=1 Tax=Perkinsus marinus (strain ATCC 50983 / TXsc) TaxID=423536 RepID=C5KXX1_PERM5|nr:conserved hypothetical protein [Perkinsus marinus ATCC 50983]EER10845.1 conserved hypothetical protein [Perkinsus marinus ATCC 50983]|eukprot:XP_002779050.1 conserved hypothetical protein [Perkinsus marinus ATCC 50983]
MNVDVSPSPPIQGIVDSLGGYATVDASGRYGSVCRVDLGDPVMVSERDQERSALGPDLLKYERKELLRVSKRIKTKSASRAKQLALRTRAAAAAAVAASKQQKDAGGNSTTAAVAQRSTAIGGGVAQHPKRSSGARLQHARMLERYGDLTRLSLETQSELEDSDGRIQRLLKRRSALSEQRVQIDREVTALQRKMREIVAASMVEAAARTTTTTTVVGGHSQQQQQQQQQQQATTESEARARLGRLAKRWQPTEDRDNKLEEDREEAERILSQRHPSPKQKVRPPEISIDMASADVDEEDEESGEARDSEGEDMEIMTEGEDSEEDAVMDDATEESEEGSENGQQQQHGDDDVDEGHE